MTDTPWLTVAEAADRARMHPETLRRALADGRLHGYQRTAPRGRWLIHIADLDAWLHNPTPSPSRSSRRSFHVA